MLVELTGPIGAHLAAVVDGRARVVDDLDHPDAVVRTDFLTFMLLACGRTDPEAHPAAGLHWTYVGSERGERNIALRNIVVLADALELDCAELVAGLKP